ncbi:MAG TPA: glycogen/starch synthase [Candidatus Omnitrophota bacterium]|nr:glycogen/starch synthase [Candidatus Omnitrophota bacterium]
MKIAFCSSEMVPFVKTGGLADVSGSLPLALQKLGVEVYLFLPRYKYIDYEVHHIKRIDDHISQGFLGKNIKVYLVENKEFFLRDGLYGDALGDYRDNLGRFHFFCIHILEALKRLNIVVDILHCHDWQTALIPVYLKERYCVDPFFKNMKSVLTIHNLAFQGVFPQDQAHSLGLNPRLFSLGGPFEFFNQINLLKAGILYSDKVSTVSPRYAQEIKTKALGCGLDDVIKNLNSDVHGILNGIDYEVWNPQKDPIIFQKYGKDNFKEKKIINKNHLQKKMGFDIADCPLFGMVSRLSHQKGIDLILDVWEAIAEKECQLIIQGVGDSRYEDRLKKMAKTHSGKIVFLQNFDEKMAHQIYAGADLFLMPSRFEPCGLSQMISMRYGTIPIVFRTGGLMDTSIAFKGPAVGDSNGFGFNDYTQEAFSEVIEQAIKTFHNKKTFQGLVENAFKADFRWDRSALEYKKMYECVLSA